MTRYFFVILLMALIGVAIVVKAGITMFAERQYWQDVADRFVKENVTVKPNRGNILSSDGKLMASSLPEYKIYMDFMSGERDEKRRKKDQQRKDSIWKANFDSICIGLHQIFPDISAATFKSHLRKGREMKSRNYNILPNRNRRISYIQYKEAKRLPVFKMNKYRGGFHEQIYNQRKKPFGSLAAQTLGRLYADTAMGARNGIELAFDTLLKGRNGITHRQKVMNKYLNIVDLPPVDGCDIISTLDVGMQDICEKALVDKLKEINANVGVAVLMEVATGEVKAIVNMMKAGDGNYYEMNSNAISDMLEPGSTFKALVLAAALEEGVVDENSTFDCPGYYMVNGVRINCSKVQGHGHQTLAEAVQNSCNPAFMMIGQRLGAEKFYDYFEAFGMTEVTGIDLPGEEKGQDWGREYITSLEGYLSLATASFGQRFTVTPLQMITAFSAVINGGNLYQPYVVQSITDARIRSPPSPGRSSARRAATGPGPFWRAWCPRAPAGTPIRRATASAARPVPPRPTRRGGPSSPLWASPRRMTPRSLSCWPMTSPRRPPPAANTAPPASTSAAATWRPPRPAS